MIEMNDDLLIKYLLKETTEEENREVQDWLAADSLNQKHFNDFELIWQQSKNLTITSTIDENDAWKRFQGKLTKKQTAREENIKPLWQNPFWRNIAAAILLVTGTWFIYTQVLTPETTILASNKVLTETLPDGSEVTLNKNAELSYSFPITARKRLVKLEKGEVFFKVSSNKAKPFIIQAHDVTIEVVGTSFNVNHLPKTTEVIVESGIVKVSDGTKTITLRKGQKVIAGSDGKLALEPVKDELYNYFRTNRFTAKNTPLSKIVEVLNKAYGVNIAIANPALADQTLTTTIEVGSLDQNLQLIAETLNLKVERSGSSILLK
jgi:ferric-dicitrate binding protein FerR (iron transport regulator)